MRKTRILLVDDHELVRSTLARCIDTIQGIEVIATAANGNDAIALAIEHRPDIVLMDIDMPGVLSFEAARSIQNRCPDTRIIFLSAFFSDRYIDEALAAGASGYLTKSEPVEAVEQAIRRVASGAAYFSPEVESRIVFDKDGIRLATDGKTRTSTLSARELEVLRYLTRGLSKKEMAELMHLSERTVNRHCSNLMDKLDIHDRVELTRYAIREGLTEP